MSATSALLAQYLSLKEQIGYYQQQQTHWSNLRDSMSAQLSKATTAETKWTDNYDKAQDKLEDEGTVKIEGQAISEATNYGRYGSEDAACQAYAYDKVPSYDPDKLSEYAELDVEYEMMVSTYDTLLEELNAQAESVKTQLGTAAKDTGTLGE